MPTLQSRRYASLPQLGSPIGNILSSGAFLSLSFLPPESFDAWGWRLPFIAAFPLLFVALWIRARVDESPAFKQVKGEAEVRKLPAVTVIREYPRAIFMAAALAFISIGGFFLVTTFAISYGTGTVGLSSATMLIATLSAAILQIVTVLVTGRLADRIEPTRLALIGCIATALLAFPAVAALSSGSPVLAVLAIVVIVQPIAISYAVTGVILPRLFGADVRYSGVAIGFNIAGLVGGFVPLIATYLLLASGSQWWTIAAFLLVIALISIIGTLAAQTTIRKRMNA